MIAKRPRRDDHAIGVELDSDFLNGWGGQLGERRGVHSEPVLPGAGQPQQAAPSGAEPRFEQFSVAHGEEVPLQRSFAGPQGLTDELERTPLVGSQQGQEPKVVRFHEQWHVLVEGVHGLVEELVHWFALRCRTWREHGNTVDEANSTRKPEALPLVAQEA
ncbi:hypothetical protein [Amycolatopsis magusensis]|uniref:hypothetical protein n=1 Tax=Amycolatopsis magusensis TaxID=882444 RepID=UPI003C2DFE08